MVAKARNLERGLIDEESTVIDYSAFCFSDQLIEETRKAIYDMPITRDDYLHFKNWNGSFGKISIFDLMKNQLLVKDKETGAEYLYESDDDLIAAGWVID